MKQLLIIILMLGLVITGRSQNPSFSPATFTAEDEVTLTIDVSGTPLAGVTPLYIWIFSNTDGGGNNGLVNGDWGNSSEDARMTPAGTNKFTFTFTGTTLFGRPPAELKNFGFLLKKKDGSGQTPDYKPFNFDPLVFVPSMLRVFPAKVAATDIVSVNFDKSHAVTTDEQRMTPVSALVTAWDETGTQVGTEIEVTSRKLQDMIWTSTFRPASRFTPGAGHQLTKLKYRFKGTTLGPDGAPVNVTSSEAEITFSNLQ
ncbi:MAG: hypothetical protein EOO05_03365 [Chitinophagaceae bacterium]|nr:MAG: hypothetical protein EOO05_03365 [Chitinophagaceae bacterium]